MEEISAILWYGAIHVASKYDDAVMIVLPSDHLIKNNEVFADTFKEAVPVTESLTL